MYTLARNFALATVALASMIGVAPQESFAYPEFVRFGYFSCTSCHVSPGGGSTLTPYGRSVGEEKVATWSQTGEGQFLHGKAGESPEWLIIGGDFRQIQTFTETERAKDGRWIPMQQDLDLCLKGGPVWGCATDGIVDRQEGQGLKRGIRKIMTRIDIGDHVLIRGGRFFPRYGLMIANHTSPIRQGLGFGPGSETDQIEASWISENFELALSQDNGRVMRLNSTDTDEIRNSMPKGQTFTGVYSLTPIARAGVSARTLKKDDTLTRMAGVFGAIGISEKTFVLAEVDRKTVGPVKSGVSHLRIGSEWTKGVVPYFLHEASVKDLTDGKTRQDTYGLGMQWYPRPHFELDMFAGHVLIRATSSYATAAYLLLHYNL